METLDHSIIMNERVAKEISILIKATRKACFMTQTKLAALTRISVPTLSCIERGTIQTSMNTIIGLFHAMDKPAGLAVCLAEARAFKLNLPHLNMAMFLASELPKNS